MWWLLWTVCIVALLALGGTTVYLLVIQNLAKIEEIQHYRKLEKRSRDRYKESL